MIVAGGIDTRPRGKQVVQIGKWIAIVFVCALASGVGMFGVDAVGVVAHVQKTEWVNIGRQINSMVGIDATDGVVDEVDFAVHEVAGGSVFEDGGGFVVFSDFVD